MGACEGGLSESWKAAPGSQVAGMSPSAAVSNPRWQLIVIGGCRNPPCVYVREISWKEVPPPQIPMLGLDLGRHGV